MENIKIYNPKFIKITELFFHTIPAKGDFIMLTTKMYEVIGRMYEVIDNKPELIGIVVSIKFENTIIT